MMRTRRRPRPIHSASRPVFVERVRMVVVVRRRMSVGAVVFGGGANKWSKGLSKELSWKRVMRT